MTNKLSIQEIEDLENFVIDTKQYIFTKIRKAISDSGVSLTQLSEATGLSASRCRAASEPTHSSMSLDTFARLIWALNLNFKIEEWESEVNTDE